MAKENKRIPIENENVGSLWKCSECKDIAEVNLQSIIESGTPYCAECDTDMEHQCTWIEPNAKYNDMAKFVAECESCGVFNDKERLQQVADSMGRTIDEIYGIISN